VAAARKAWRERQPSLNPAQLVFIDETWATTNMARLRGRCQRGKRLIAAVPHRHWKTSTFVAGLRTSGLTGLLVLDGAMNGEAFRAYVEQILAPTLGSGDIVVAAFPDDRQCRRQADGPTATAFPGAASGRLLARPKRRRRFLAYVEQTPPSSLDIVIIDNLGSHKGKAIRHAPFAPPAPSSSKYSPDLNPIEQVFAKLKTLLRRAASDPLKPSGARSPLSSHLPPARMRQLLPKLWIRFEGDGSDSSRRLSPAKPQRMVER
jgi:transposase